MIITILISLLTIISTILLIVLFPKVTIKNFSFQTFYIPSLIGAILLLLCKVVSVNDVISLMLSSDGMNPIKILLLFISMSALSIVLDEVGLFKYLANFMLEKAGKSQLSVFVALFLGTSILTVFTSNDVIILTFTPFIIFFCKNAKVNPIPYLVSEFCAANTLSMLLMIGNPTNIYITSSMNIDFFKYFNVMFLPTVCATIVEFMLLLVIFRKDLKHDINPVIEDVKIKDIPIVIVGLFCLISCTILLAISSYLPIEMYFICVVFASILFSFLFVYTFISRKNKDVLISSIKRLPYTLIPFLLSMFVIVICLSAYDINEFFANIFNKWNPVFLYEFTSLFACNVMNNIPMSVFYAEILKSADVLFKEKAAFATVIGSNIGAFISPMGALAGIMWMSILKRYDIKYSFLDFVKYGVLIGIPTALVAGVMLYFI